MHEEVDAFIRKYGAPILFTGGTGVFDTDEIFSVGREACDQLGLPVLFVGGEVEDEELFAPENVLHVKYIDFEYIFPKCRAIVHHGGVGTLAQAIRARVPQLIRPHAFDQFDNADKVFRLGLGSFIEPKKFTVERVQKALNAMIESEQVKANLIHFSAIIKRDQPIEKICNLIEDYIQSPNNSYKPALYRAVDLYIKKSKQSIAEIPPFKRKSKKTLGDYESLAAWLQYFGKKITPELSPNKRPVRLLLQDILRICKESGVSQRTLQCEAHNLTDVKLPCLIQWQTNRFVILIGFENSYAIIRDPIFKREKYPLHEFQWNYSGIVIEFSPG